MKERNTSRTGPTTSRPSWIGRWPRATPIGQEGSIGGEQGRFAYLDTEAEQGTVIEISDISGPKGQFFQYIRDVAATWDGSDPIRGRE